jgi:hypothetical protein
VPLTVLVVECCGPQDVPAGGDQLNVDDPHSGVAGEVSAGTVEPGPGAVVGAIDPRSTAHAVSGT